MIRSMTGFGRSAFAVGGARFDVEVTASIEPGPSGKARPFVPLGR